MWVIQCIFFLLLLRLKSLCADLDSTDPQDVAALWSLMDQWQNVPPGWDRSCDPCAMDTPWEGVTCSNRRVITLHVSSMNIAGTLSDDIGNITELTSLDLSYNRELGGLLAPSIGNLSNLEYLILAGFNFTGSIPSQLGNLTKLSLLALNSNNFNGTIPTELGCLQNLYRLDLAENQLAGTLPMSYDTCPGLGSFVNTKYLYFSNNQLSGLIDGTFFFSIRPLQLLLDGNQFNGPIPDSVGSMHTLQALRLDNNQLTHQIPDSISNLTSLRELNLAGNKLYGPLPDLSRMSKLNYVNLSSNSFDASPIPEWIRGLTSLTTLVLECTGLYGEVPHYLLTNPQLQQVSELQVLSLQNNVITWAIIDFGISTTLMLVGNPVCMEKPFSKTDYCSLQQRKLTPYSTSLVKCSPGSCPSDQSTHPQDCSCVHSHKGAMVFRSPLFTYLTNSTLLRQLEAELQRRLSLAPGFLYLSDILNSGGYMQVHLNLFPSGGLYFNRSEIVRINYALTNEPYTHPQEFGAYYYLPEPYPFPGRPRSKKSSMTAAAKAGIAVSCTVVAIGLALGTHALQQKKKSQMACELTGHIDGRSTSLFQKARQFSLDELKVLTANFSESNMIGIGGFGKVYKGSLLSGQIVAIKRLELGSAQGEVEFQAEIQLLSRVHHKNLVNIVGFCIEQGEQILVYEYISNGTLEENLTARHGVRLDWNKRLQIALGSARGLAYLHELASPPIIHRDVKSANILLDRNFNAKVSDFGLSKVVSDMQKWHVSSQIKGTLGYLDPEYYMTQVLTEKSDVYSFGVVMLQMITSRQPIENGNHIAREVWISIDQYDEKYYGLEDSMDSAIKDAAQYASLRRFVQLAMACVALSPSNRPTMTEVVQEIESILKNAGTDISSNSTCLPAITYVRNKRAGSPHLQSEQILLREETDGAFEYTDGHPYSAKI